MNTNSATVVALPRRAEARVLSTILLRAGAVLGFALLTALAAQVRFYLPSTPVPVTLQTLVVLLAGVTLGPGLGTLSMALYLALGAAGYGVFAQDWGVAALGGPTAGYLAGFVLAQPALGWLTRRESGGAMRLLAGMIVANLIIFGCGAAWLALTLGVSAEPALALGVLPFVTGTIIQTSLAYAVGLAVIRRRRAST